MQFSNQIKSLIFISLILCVIVESLAQEKKQVLFPIANQSDIYEGAGIDWILRRADSSQFVLFGEQHGVAGVAAFVTFIYENLQESSFNYLVLETDGWTTQRSTATGVIPFTKKNPHSIAFDSNDDLTLMQSAIDNNPKITTPIWGIDQMQTAIHPFYRLTEIATTSRQKKLARGAFLKASLKMGHYTRQNHRQDIDVLEKVFAKNSNQEKNQIFRELKLTIEIFSKWMNPATRQESVTIRERLMDQNFDNYLNATPDAKAVFKMGGAHTMYGIGPNGILTFGDHVAKVAESNNQSILSISISRFDPERSLITASDFGEHSMVLLDTDAALRLAPNDSSRLLQRDAIIYLKDAGYADKGINYTFEKEFKNSLIASILPLGLGLLFSLIMFVVSTILMIAKRKNRTKKMRLSTLGSALLIGLVGLQILQILKFPSYHAAIDPGLFPYVMHSIFGIFSFAYCYFMIMILRDRSASIFSKIGYSLFTIGFCAASYSVYHWNIGGML